MSVLSKIKPHLKQVLGKGIVSVLVREKKRIQQKLGLLEPSFEDKISPVVETQALAIIKAHQKTTQDNALFIDMGSNLGQGFEFFSTYYDPDIFDYWLIEPNPFCINALRGHVADLYKKHGWKNDWEIREQAVSNKNGILKLYGLVEDARGDTSSGASVIQDHNSVYYNTDEDKAVKVKSKKASTILREASKKYKTIVVKMDIESSEYDALEDLISTGLIKKIDHIYVEWHAEYFSKEKLGDILKRENSIKKILGEKLTNWH